MWYLNFCSPFLYIAGTSAMSYRIVMYSQIFALFLVYLAFALFYRFGSQLRIQAEKIKGQDPQTLLTLSKISCSPDGYWVSSKKFKEWYLSYFGLHAVAVGICIFYSPYLPQMIFTLIHFGLWIVVSILIHFKDPKRKVINIIFNILMVLTCLLNVMLLFSGSMGVGASGYDQNAKLCLLQSQDIRGPPSTL